MNKKFIRPLSAALLLSVLLSSTASCGLIVFNTGGVNDDTSDKFYETTGSLPSDNGVGDTVQTNPDPALLARERLSDLPEKDMSETSVIIVTADASLIPAKITETPDVIARSDSIRAVEEKYNTSVVAINRTPEVLFLEAREAYNADMYYADLLAIPQSTLGRYFGEGLLSNLRSLPHVNLDASYYNSSFTSASVAGSGVYAVSGAASFNPDYLRCVYFNRDMVAHFAGEDLYSLVDEGKWTIDKMAELAKTVTSEKTLYGHGSPLDLYDYIDAAATSQGVSYVSNAEGTVPTVDYLATPTTSNVADVVSKLRSLFYSDKSYIKTTGTALRDIFAGNTLMFMTDNLRSAELISNSGVSWGILPLPKFDESQEEYISPMAKDASVFSVLQNTPRYETSGLILEALNIASYEYVTDAYINRQIDYVLRDAGSISTLELICGTAYTDFAHIYSSGISNLESATYGAVYKAVTTRSGIDALYRNLKNSANRSIASKVKVYN